jgi:hypothetical protein
MTQAGLVLTADLEPIAPRKAVAHAIHLPELVSQHLGPTPIEISDRRCQPRRDNPSLLNLIKPLVQDLRIARWRGNGADTVQLLIYERRRVRQEVRRRLTVILLLGTFELLLGFRPRLPKLLTQRVDPADVLRLAESAAPASVVTVCTPASPSPRGSTPRASRPTWGTRISRSPSTATGTCCPVTMRLRATSSTPT